VRSPFLEIAQNFIRNRFMYLYVVDDSRHFKGVISLHDIKSYLNNPELADLVIANDLLREQFLTVTPKATLAEALEQFTKHDGDRLPVIEDGVLMGSVSKTDLLLALSEQTKHEETAHQAAA
jgi:CIC family chloride channel protein